MTRRLPASFSLLMAAVAQPAWAQTLGGGATGDVDWARVVAALLLCLALGIGGAFVLRARLRGQAPAGGRRLWTIGRSLGMGEAGARRLQLLESVRVSRNVDVCLVRCDDREFVVAASLQSVAILPTGQASPRGEAE